MKFYKKLIFCLICAVCILDPSLAHAGRTLVDALDLSPMVPLILDTMMMVATGTYEFFVGDGNGFIYIFIWLFFLISTGLYLIKMYIPKKWLEFIGMSGGGELWEGKVAPMSLAKTLLKPAGRVIIATFILLQVKPIFVTEWIVNPFLQLGSVYTNAIISTVREAGYVSTTAPVCPESIVEKAWLSESACNFLVQPVVDITHANNNTIKRGFMFIKSGFRGMLTLTSGVKDGVLDIISGIFLVVTFVGCNLFMAFLIFQAIFNFGIALTLYPFNVLVWTVKPSDKWLDVWPAFSRLVKSLQDLIITMIACAFILGLNIALIRALFQGSTTVYEVAANGSATTNMPSDNIGAMGFGAHSVFWLSSILTFYVMQRLFDATREQLNSYTKGMDSLYKQVKGDVKTTYTNVKNTTKTVGKAIKFFKKKK